ncbi:MAG: hypothetical protein SFZ24_10910, partial [Planctomycetota bacterium]|nr:hypothetical protein [Planctomycetota bacterium]
MSGRLRWVVGWLARWPARGLAAGCLVGLAAAAMGRSAGLVAPVFPFLTLDMMSADGLISLHGCAGPDASMYGWDVQLLRNRW